MNSECLLSPVSMLSKQYKAMLSRACVIHHHVVAAGQTFGVLRWWNANTELSHSLHLGTLCCCICDCRSVFKKPHDNPAELGVDHTGTVQIFPWRLVLTETWQLCEHVTVSYFPVIVLAFRNSLEFHHCAIKRLFIPFMHVECFPPLLALCLFDGSREKRRKEICIYLKLAIATDTAVIGWATFMCLFVVIVLMRH